MAWEPIAQADGQDTPGHQLLLARERCQRMGRTGDDFVQKAGTTSANGRTTSVVRAERAQTEFLFLALKYMISILIMVHGNSAQIGLFCATLG